jgi:hypothetical protein
MRIQYALNAGSGWMDPVPLRRVVRMGRELKAKGRSLQTTRIAPGAGIAGQCRQSC